MGVFQSEKTFNCNPALINVIVDNIVKDFRKDEYECGVISGKSEERQISIRKGGIFKTVLGMKTALNVTVMPYGANKVYVKAEIGLFETQALPTMVAYFIFWPIFVAQIWGLVQQSHLDERVMDIVEKTIRFTPVSAISEKDRDRGIPF